MIRSCLGQSPLSDREEEEDVDMPGGSRRFATTKGRVLYCRRCEGHGKMTILRGHGPLCPYLDCQCRNCERLVRMRKNAFVRRYRENLKGDEEIVSLHTDVPSAQPKLRLARSSDSYDDDDRYEDHYSDGVQVQPTLASPFPPSAFAAQAQLPHTSIASMQHEELVRLLEKSAGLPFPAAVIESDKLDALKRNIASLQQHAFETAKRPNGLALALQQQQAAQQAAHAQAAAQAQQAQLQQQIQQLQQQHQLAALTAQQGYLSHAKSAASAAPVSRAAPYPQPQFVYPHQRQPLRRPAMGAGSPIGGMSTQQAAQAAQLAEYHSLLRLQQQQQAAAAQPARRASVGAATQLQQQHMAQLQQLRARQLQPSGPDDPVFRAFLDQMRQCEMHMTRIISEGVQQKMTSAGAALPLAVPTVTVSSSTTLPVTLPTSLPSLPPANPPTLTHIPVVTLPHV